MSGSQRTSSIYAREALIEIDYGDLCEDLKVRISHGGGDILPAVQRESQPPPGGPMETMAGKRGRLARKGGSCDLGSPLTCAHTDTDASSTTTLSYPCPCLLPVFPFHTCTHLSPDAHTKGVLLYSEQMGLGCSLALCPSHSSLLTFGILAFWVSFLLPWPQLPCVLCSTGTSDPSLSQICPFSLVPATD